MIYAVNKNVLSEHRLLDATEGLLYVRQPQTSFSFTETVSRLALLLGQLLLISIVLYILIVAASMSTSFAVSRLQQWRNRRNVKASVHSAMQSHRNNNEQFVYDVEKFIGTPDLSYSPSSTSSLNDMTFSPPQPHAVTLGTAAAGLTKSFIPASALDILKGGSSSEEQYVKIR